MEELKRFQGSTLDTISSRRLVENRDTILELTGKIQELQNEINCMNDSRDFQDAESVRSGQSHVTSQPCFSHLSEILAERKAVLWECRAATMGRQRFGTRMVYRETFLQIQRRLLQHLVRKGQIPGSPIVSEHTSPHVMSESQTPSQDQRCQSGPSARNSVVPSEGGCSKNYGADNNDCRFQNLILTNSPRQQRSLDRGLYLFTISYGSYAVDQKS